MEETVNETEAGTAPVEEQVAEEGTAAPEVEVAAVDPMAAERDDLRNQLLRARAEFDNYRKRMLRESEQIRKTAARALIEDLLPVLDNLERALEHVTDPAVDPVLQGVDMVVKSLHGKLASHGLEPIVALGQPFDPNVHEALAHQPSEEHAADVVVAEYHRGYRLGDAVLRPAKVAVSSGPPVSE